MRWHRTLGAALTALALAACGGGDGVDGGIGGTGTGTPGVAYGTITGFGSVWVNGVRYESSTAVIRIDDNPKPESDLRLGMVARVDATIDDSGATATAISVDSAIKGYVEALPSVDRITVMGQTVQVDALTVFDDNLRPALGQYVEVHGLPLAGGVGAASYVERKASLATPPFVVTGFVGTHDTAAQRFTVGGLTVQYAGAEIDDLPGGSWVGLLVEVKGSACAGQPVCATLTASKVESGGAGVASAAKAEVEGFVTAVGNGSFVLGGQTVTYGAGTVFENGTAANLRVGAKVEAEGAVSSGILAATKVEFRSEVRLEGNVASNGAGGFTLLGLPGITVQADGLTELDGVADPALLAVGNHVSVRGRLAPGNLVVATELEVQSTSPEAEVQLRGPVEAIAGSVLTVLGQAIDVSGLEGGASVLAGVEIGREVNFDGVLAGTTVVWEEVELED